RWLVRVGLHRVRNEPRIRSHIEPPGTNEWLDGAIGRHLLPPRALSPWPSFRYVPERTGRGTGDRPRRTTLGARVRSGPRAHPAQGEDRLAHDRRGSPATARARGARTGGSAARSGRTRWVELGSARRRVGGVTSCSPRPDAGIS